MKSLLLLLWAPLLVAAAPTPSLPPAPLEGRLEITANGDAPFTAAPVTVSGTLLDPSSPSCAVIKRRIDFTRKQYDELLSTLDRADQGRIAELAELRRRLLMINAMLTRPWAKMEAVFTWPTELPAESKAALLNGIYGVDLDVAGRQWSSPDPALPPDLELSLSESGATLGWTWTAYEFCFWQGGVNLRLTLQ
jgi:hypothetical protein